MWFVEQFDSFLNLGICKEYPMARSKSTSGGKADRTNTNANNEQTSHSNPANIPGNIPDVQAVAAEAAPAGITPEAKGTPRPRKLGVARAEPRKNPIKVVPVNLLPINLEDEIRRRAYELYQQRGTAPGSEAEDWLTAEREVRQRYRQQSA
jgi:hypothetical protein